MDLPGNSQCIFYFLIWLHHMVGASPVVQTVKNLPAMQETLVQSLEAGRSPGEGTGNPFQYSCLENPINRGAVHGVIKSRTPMHMPCGILVPRQRIELSAPPLEVWRLNHWTPGNSQGMSFRINWKFIKYMCVHTNTLGQKLDGPAAV